VAICGSKGRVTSTLCWGSSVQISNLCSSSAFFPSRLPCCTQVLQPALACNWLDTEECSPLYNHNSSRMINLARLSLMAKEIQDPSRNLSKCSFISISRLMDEAEGRGGGSPICVSALKSGCWMGWILCSVCHLQIFNEMFAAWFFFPSSLLFISYYLSSEE